VYTVARRHPWVLGKLGDFKLWLGPYTPAQIVVAFFGALVLIKTVSWWSWLGPLPLAAWAAAVWVVRRPRIAGRAMAPAALGWLMFLTQPSGGRRSGRRAARCGIVHGGFVVEEAPASPSVPAVAAQPPRRQTSPSSGQRVPGAPLSPLQQVLAAKGVRA
jgi:hypothetical protein